MNTLHQSLTALLAKLEEKDILYPTILTRLGVCWTKSNFSIIAIVQNIIVKISITNNTTIVVFNLSSLLI